MDKWTVKTDGGCPGNPGPGSFAFVVDKHDGTKLSRSGYLPSATNNQAEYRGVTAAAFFLNGLKELPSRLEFWSDSQLIVNQLNGKYAVHDDTLRPFFNDSRMLLESLRRKGSKVTMNWFRRENNSEADELCNQVLERHGVHIANKKRKAA